MRSLADSDEVFELACDLNEVIDILYLLYIVYFSTYLTEILIWKKVNLLVRYVLVICYLCSLWCRWLWRIM